ncbi:hypothetical protein NE237_025748 [Protea cynaroides]|uniref:Phytocyanin domain-containing protein n=1 Tax=Protea cynaroides TaxID=273540 RepID=A0A9Q0K0T6_9MAGN|nr:hypothetical protein NE237_025748 [Protea cynaroides]
MDRQVVWKVAAVHVVVIMALQLHCTAGGFQSPHNSYIVGDSLGWTIPPGGAATYADWTVGKTFFIKDSLLIPTNQLNHNLVSDFNFTKGSQTVVLVDKAGFDSCTSGTGLTIVYDKDPPVEVVLGEIGENYFICTVAGHCQKGQKFAINVTTTTPSYSSGTSNITSTSTNVTSITSTSTSSSTSSAPSSGVGVMGFFLISFFRTTIVAFLL